MGLLDKAKSALGAAKDKARETVDAAREGHAEPYTPAPLHQAGPSVDGSGRPVPMTPAQGQPTPYAQRTPETDPTLVEQPGIPGPDGARAPGQLPEPGAR